MAVVKMLYVCEGCGTEYDQIWSAMSCEQQETPGPIVAVGDIVTIGYGRGWQDGDKRWIINPDTERRYHKGLKVECPNGHGNCFNECCTWGFYYVVTKIDKKDHRVRYHLETRAMTGKQGYRLGYTYNDGHVRPKRVEHPSAYLVRSGRLLIGHEARRLV